MEFNVFECRVVPFSRLAAIYNFNYHVVSDLLDLSDSIKDLGVILTATLSPVEFITRITSRTYSLLGFVFKSTRYFTKPHPLLQAFKLLIHPVMEYVSVVWTNFQLGHIEILNRVHTRFMRLFRVRLVYAFLETPIVRAAIQCATTCPQA